MVIAMLSASALVILSAAKDLMVLSMRSFAALRMTTGGELGTKP